MEPMIRFLHVTGVVLFLGTLFCNHRIKKTAESQDNPDVLSFAYKLIRKNDVALTLPGMLLLLVGGFGLAGVLKAAIAKKWFFVSMGLMLGVLGGWMGGIIPAQIALSKFEKPELSQDDVAKASKKWNVGWTICMVSTLSTLLLMIGRHAIL